MARELEGDRGERFGMPTLEGIGAIARKLGCSPKSVLRRARDRVDPLWVLVDPFEKKWAFLAAVESWVQRRTLSLQTHEQVKKLKAKKRSTSKRKAA